MNRRTFYIHSPDISYRETELRGDPVFEKCYLIRNPKGNDIVAIPDGCLDFQFVWSGDTCRGYLCGSYLKGSLSKVSAYPVCFGLKLHPGILPDFLENACVSAFMNRRIPVSEFADITALEKALKERDEFEDLLCLALPYFRRFRYSSSHCVANDTELMIMNSSGTTRIGDVIRHLGYSQRYVDNVFKSHYGVTVKKYADIVRAQRAIDSLAAGNVNDVMEGLGYYDQAHFIHSFKNYTSITPKTYMKQVRESKRAVIV